MFYGTAFGRWRSNRYGWGCGRSGWAILGLTYWGGGNERGCGGITSSIFLGNTQVGGGDRIRHRLDEGFEMASASEFEIEILRLSRMCLFSFPLLWLTPPLQFLDSRVLSVPFRRSPPRYLTIKPGHRTIP